MDLEELKASFSLEAIELLDEAEDALLDFDNSNDFTGCYNKVFRSFHSLKGASGMFGLDDLQEHMHKLESLLDKLESFPDGSIDYFLSGIDEVRNYFNGQKIEFNYVDSFDGTVEVKTIQRNEKASKGNGLVFVVDDEKIIVEMIADLLEEAGYVVEKFYDGSEVLKSIETLTPDLIVSDIKMPEVDGITMLGKIKELDIEVPIIFISAYVTKEAVLEGLKSGASYFIEKPFNENFIISLVDTLVKMGKAKKALSHGIDCILYQFANIEDVLESNGLSNDLGLIKSEIKNLLEVKKMFLG